MCNKLTVIFFHQLYISTTNSIAYLTVGHYYNNPMRSRHMRKANPFIWQCRLVILKAQAMPQFNWYTCWTSLGANGMPDKLLRKAWNSPIKSRFSLRKDQRISQDMLHLTKHNLDPSISLRSCFLISSWRSLLDFMKPRRRSNTVQPDGPVFSGRWSHRVDQRCRQAMLWQYTPHEGKLWWVYHGLPWGSFWVPKHWQPTDSLALCCQETRVHANAWVYVVMSAALQLPWWQLLPSNNGATHGLREKQTSLSCAAKGASV